MTIESSARRSELEDLKQACTLALNNLLSMQDNSISYPILGEPKYLRTIITEPSDEPQLASSLSEVISNAIELMLNGMCNVYNPNYFGYISPRPHPASILGDFLASTLNQTPGAWRAGPGATAIEVQVLHWLRTLFKLPPVTGPWPGGIFTGGGTIANLAALKLARDFRLGDSVKRTGLDSNKYRVYTSTEGHFSLDKAMDMLGFGQENLVRIPTDKYGAIKTDELLNRLTIDVSNNLIPICLVATAGTTATGAVDPLLDCSVIAKEFNMWFHVDGASGLAITAIPKIRQQLEGLDKADSITFDPCKWMFTSFGVGCLLVQDGELLAKSFSAGGHYWEETEDLDTFKMNIYGTRQFRSLGIWTYLNYVGFDGYRSHVSNLLIAAQSLKDMLSADSRYVLMEQHQLMPIVCFQVSAEDSADRSTLSTEVVNQCQAQGESYPTLMDWHGNSFIRVAISNYTTTPENMRAFKQSIDLIVDSIKVASHEF